MSFSELESVLYLALLVWAALALLVTCVAVQIAKRQLGPAVHVHRGDRRGRLGVGLLCLGVLALLWLNSGGSPVVASIAIGLAILVSALAPGVEDMALGENGARHGWQARNWGQLEGWRLVGSHLRFLVHGELVAVEVPASEIESLRTKLDARCKPAENTLGTIGPSDSSDPGDSAA